MAWTCGGYIGQLEGSRVVCFCRPYLNRATCGLQPNGNAMSHSPEEILYVCVVAVLIEGGHNCEEGKPTVPCCKSAAELSMWREVEYHILVCGLVVWCLVLETRYRILVDWQVLVDYLREVAIFSVCHNGLCVVSKDQTTSKDMWSGGCSLLQGSINLGMC